MKGKEKLRITGVVLATRGSGLLWTACPLVQQVYRLFDRSQAVEVGIYYTCPKGSYTTGTRRFSTDFHYSRLEQNI